MLQNHHHHRIFWKILFSRVWVCFVPASLDLISSPKKNVISVFVFLKAVLHCNKHDWNICCTMFSAFLTIHWNFWERKILKTFALYLARSIFDSLPGEEKVENGGNLNRAMHKLQKAKMKSGNAEIFGRNLHKSLWNFKKYLLLIKMIMLFYIYICSLSSYHHKDHRHKQDHHRHNLFTR